MKRGFQKLAALQEESRPAPRSEQQRNKDRINSYLGNIQTLALDMPEKDRVWAAERMFDVAMTLGAKDLR